MSDWITSDGHSNRDTLPHAPLSSWGYLSHAVPAGNTHRFSNSIRSRAWLLVKPLCSTNDSQICAPPYTQGVMVLEDHCDLFPGCSASHHRGLRLSDINDAAIPAAAYDPPQSGQRGPVRRAKTDAPLPQPLLPPKAHYLTRLTSKLTPSTALTPLRVKNAQPETSGTFVSTLSLLTLARSSQTVMGRCLVAHA